MPAFNPVHILVVYTPPARDATGIVCTQGGSSQLLGWRRLPQAVPRPPSMRLQGAWKHVNSSRGRTKLNILLHTDPGSRVHTACVDLLPTTCDT